MDGTKTQRPDHWLLAVTDAMENTLNWTEIQFQDVYDSFAFVLRGEIGILLINYIITPRRRWNTEYIWMGILMMIRCINSRWHKYNFLYGGDMRTYLHVLASE